MEVRDWMTKSPRGIVRWRVAGDEERKEGKEIGA
jgi:hypothetical protein